MREPCGLKIVTLIPGCGYGDAGSQYIAGLHGLGVPVTWTPIPGQPEKILELAKCRPGIQETVSEILPDLWRRQLDCDAILVDVPPPDAQMHWRQAEPDLRPFTYVAWEVERLPNDWPPALNLYDRVFVPSTFNQQALVAGGITAPVDIVPHLARDVTPVVGGPRWGTVEDDDFVFYTIGSWTTRKAMEETIRAYLASFGSSEKVALIVKTDAINQPAFAALTKEQRKSAPPHIAMVWWTVTQIIAGYANPAKVHLIAEGLSPRDIDRLHTRGDCFVSLTHGEGWGLGSFDAALFGKPAIITGWGGQLDYLGAGYPLLIRYEMAPTNESTADGYFMETEGTDWARADQSHASELMRFVFENRSEARSVARELQPQLQTRYAADPVCRRLAGLMGYDIEQ